MARLRARYLPDTAAGMSTVPRAVLCCASVLAVASVAGIPSARAETAPTDEGRALYVEVCASCHGSDGTGNGPVIPALKMPPPDLTALAQRNQGVFPRERVLQVVTGEHRVDAHGSREMPVWSQRFAPTGSGATAAAAVYMRRRLELLLDYIASIQRQ